MSIYPLVTWLVTVPGFTVTVTIDGVAQALAVSDGVYYGWETTGTVVGSLSQATLRAATSASLAYAFAAALATHANAGPVAAYYGERTGSAWQSVQSGSGEIGWFIDFNPSDNDAQITATSDPAALALFGLKVGDSLNQTTLVNRRTAGIWRPKFAPPAQLEPNVVAIGTGAVSDYSAATQDRLLFGGQLIWSVLWEYVEAADISRELLNIADYLPVANRAPGDTLGTLDDLLWALANGLIVKLALPPKGDAAIVYVDSIVNVQGSIDRTAYTTEAAVGARRYHVTLAMLATQDYDPGTPL